MGLSLCAFTLTSVSLTRHVLNASDLATRPRPAWVKDGIVMVGNWEPLTFVRRRGGETEADLENWKGERTEAVARQLKAEGINLVITNFHKGFGLQTEGADIEATRKFVEYAHRNDIRVGGYIGSSMMYETLFSEEPNAKDWKQIDENGNPIYYIDPSQTFRYMACRNNPGYQEFIRKLLRVGVDDLKLDLVHFDQMESWAEPQVCHCQFCSRQFRQYLRSRYSDSQLVERFGFARLADMKAPAFAPFIAAGLPELINPLMQDWIRFQAWSYAKRYGEYDTYLQSLNPAVALEGNPNIDFSYAKGSFNSVDYSEFLDHGDIVWSESPQQASWTDDGRLISSIRAFKVARSRGKSLFVYTGGRYGATSPESPSQLRMAETMAYNDMNLGMVGDVSTSGVSLTLEGRRYIDFFHAHKQQLRGTATLADAAILRSAASVDFNPSKAHVSTVLFEQSLIQGKILFDIIFDRDLADLSKYKVLILADQDALSDAEIASIRHFVEQGGGLVATGSSSLLTDSRIRRRKFGLGDLFGIDEPPGSDVQAGSIRRTYGSGRVAYIPNVIPSIAPPPAKFNYRFDASFWKLPRNHDDLIAAVDWASGGHLSVHTNAPLSVTLELAKQKNSGLVLLHLVNFDFRHPLTNVQISLRLPPHVEPTSVSVQSPDDGSQRVLKSTVENGTATFVIPRLSVYDLTLIKLSGS